MGNRGSYVSRILTRVNGARPCAQVEYRLHRAFESNSGLLSATRQRAGRRSVKNIAKGLNFERAAQFHASGETVNRMRKREKERMRERERATDEAVNPLAVRHTRRWLISISLCRFHVYIAILQEISLGKRRINGSPVQSLFSTAN